MCSSALVRVRVRVRDRVRVRVRVRVRDRVRVRVRVRFRVRVRVRVGVGHHASDAHHRRAAIVALGVQLELLAREAGLVLVPDPRERNHVTGPAVRLLLEDRVVEERDNQHNLHPREARQRRPRGDRAAGHVRELDVLGEREIPRPAEARLSSAQISSNPDDKVHSQKERRSSLPLEDFAFLGDQKA